MAGVARDAKSGSGRVWQMCGSVWQGVAIRQCGSGRVAVD
jgi:hypothetical protein